MGRAVSMLLSECVYSTGFLGRSLTSCKNMTEDDWRWHMYDTVRPNLETNTSTRPYAFTYLYRLKGQTGSAIRMQFTI